MCNLQGMDQRNRNRLTDIENKLVGAKGEGRIGVWDEQMKSIYT